MDDDIPIEVKCEIGRIINSHTCVVSQKMLDYFIHKVKNGDYSSLENAQAEALEFSLREVGLLKTKSIVPGESYQWRHDWWFEFIAYSLLIDLKRKPHDSNNISIGDLKGKARQSYDMGELTHYCAYSQNTPNKTFLKIGDVLTFKFLELVTFKYATKNANQIVNCHLLNVT